MFGLGGFIAGIILIIIGGGLIFFFPSTPEYQPDEFSILVVVVGFIMIIAGAVLIFV
jgi:hypothetical protein